MENVFQILTKKNSIVKGFEDENSHLYPDYGHGMIGIITASGALSMENEHYEPGTGNIVDAVHQRARQVDGANASSVISYAVLEPHIYVAYLYGYERLIVVSSTQVPYYTRRQLAAVLELPISRIRKLKPRVGNLVASYTRKDFAGVRYISRNSNKGAGYREGIEWYKNR